MAKWGEGDPRWIVEERADAVNVNNWHWLVSFNVFVNEFFGHAELISTCVNGKFLSREILIFFWIKRLDF